MNAAPAPLAPAVAAHRGPLERRIVTIPISRDLSWRGIEYRLAEGIRDAGAKIIPAPIVFACDGCTRRVRAGAGERYVYPQPLRPIALCIPCGIKHGHLIPVGEPR